MTGAPDRLAVIDIGTNSVRLTGADLDDGELRIGLDLGDVTRLGAGLATDGVIDPRDERRTADYLAYLLTRCRAEGYGEPRIVGTEVFRAAGNGRDVAERLARLTGVPVEILPATEEAQAAFRGAMDGIPSSVPVTAVADIGGGSTELILGASAGVRFSQSLPLGALRVTSQWLLHDPPLPRELADAEAGASAACKAFSPEVARAAAAGVFIGVGGSFCALGAHAGRVIPYQPDRVHGLVVPRVAADRALADWSGQPLPERAAQWGIGEGRARVVIGGVLVIRALLDHLGVSAVRISVRGLRHGLLLASAGSRPSRD